MSGFVTPTTPNQADYLTFIRDQGIGQAFLPDNSMWIGITFNVAMGIVNDTLNAANASLYTLAVYNLGVDRLINFASDQEGQTYFADWRVKLGIYTFASGLVASSSDSGTSQSLQVIEAAKRMTLQDLQHMKTTWGRVYSGFAQQYGPTVWGLT